MCRENRKIKRGKNILRDRWFSICLCAMKSRAIEIEAVNCSLETSRKQL
jgi:hypothetical protein